MERNANKKHLILLCLILLIAPGYAQQGVRQNVEIKLIVDTENFDPGDIPGSVDIEDKDGKSPAGKAKDWLSKIYSKRKVTWIGVPKNNSIGDAVIITLVEQIGGKRLLKCQVLGVANCKKFKKGSPRVRANTRTYKNGDQIYAIHFKFIHDGIESIVYELDPKLQMRF